MHLPFQRPCGVPLRKLRRGVLPGMHQGGRPGEIRADNDLSGLPRAVLSSAGKARSRTAFDDSHATDPNTEDSVSSLVASVEGLRYRVRGCCAEGRGVPPIEEVGAACEVAAPDKEV